MKLWSIAAAVLLLSMFAVVACSDDDDGGPTDAAGTASPSTTATATATPEPRHITFMAGFRAQANLPFVAVYVARELGYFAEEGLDVDIQHSAGQDEHLKLLLSKEIEFTTGTAAQVLVRRGDDLPVKAIALFGQRGDQGYVVRADSGIYSPADFKGKSVGFKAGVVPTELKALLASVGLSEDDVRLQGVGFDPRVFMEGGVDVYPVFLNNEPFTIQKAGVPITVFDPADYGVATLGVTFLAHEDTVEDDPDLVQRFVRAAMRGVQYAADNIDVAVDITLKYAEGADPEQQKFLLETDLENAKRADGMGRSTAEQWEALQDTLLQYGALEDATDASEAFDGTFVDSLYDAQGHLKPR